MADEAELDGALDEEAGVAEPAEPDDDAGGEGENADGAAEDAGDEDGVGDAAGAAAALTVPVTVPATAETVLAGDDAEGAGLDGEVADGEEDEEPVAKDDVAGAVEVD